MALGRQQQCVLRRQRQSSVVLAAHAGTLLGPGTYSSSQLHGVGYVEAEDGVVGDRRVEEVDERDGIEHGHLELAPAERVWPFSCSVA